MTKPSINPPPAEATDAEVMENPILHYFHYSHLPPHMADQSKGFCDLALNLVRTTDPSAERAAALRKLLEAKDCAVRAALSSDR